MLNTHIAVLILVLIFGFVWWIVTALMPLPLPEPFGRIAQVIIVLIFLLLLIGVFFGGVNLPTPRL